MVALIGSPSAGKLVPLLAKTFGEWLTEVRGRRGLGVRELGRISNISHATISKIEDSKVGASREMVIKLATALEVSRDEAIRAWLEDETQEGGAILYVADPDVAQMVEAYEGLPSPVKGFIRSQIVSAADLARELDRKETVGGTRSDNDVNPTQYPDD